VASQDTTKGKQEKSIAERGEEKMAQSVKDLDAAELSFTVGD